MVRYFQAPLLVGSNSLGEPSYAAGTTIKGSVVAFPVGSTVHCVTVDPAKSAAYVRVEESDSRTLPTDWLPMTGVEFSNAVFVSGGA